MYSEKQCLLEITSLYCRAEEKDQLDIKQCLLVITSLYCRAEEKDQLDIKWYFNSSPTPIYQWLPAMNTGPQVIDPR